MKMIIIAAAIITDSQGRCLLVRKRGTEYFMQPGGKPEIGETPHAALIRELEEELNFSVSPEELVQVGRFTDAAANEQSSCLCGCLSDSHEQGKLYTDDGNRRSDLVYAGSGSAY